MVAKQKYDLKITLVKGAWIAGEVVASGLIVYLTDNNVFLAIVPLIEMLKNYLKHK